MDRVSTMDTFIWALVAEQGLSNLAKKQAHIVREVGDLINKLNLADHSFDYITRYLDILPSVKPFLDVWIECIIICRA